MFKKGQLVQVYRNDLMNTLSTDRKLQPTWSGPYRIREQILNSYKLEDLDGTPKVGEYSARRLRTLTPREGTELARTQQELEEKIEREEMNNLKEMDLLEDEQSEELEEESEEELEEDSSIASQVASRRGCRQKDGGGWNR